LGLGKCHPRYVHEGSEVKQSYSSIQYLTLALDGGRTRHAPVALPLERDLVSGIKECGWAPGLIWAHVGNVPHLRHGQWNREKSFVIIYVKENER